MKRTDISVARHGDVVAVTVTATDGEDSWQEAYEVVRDGEECDWTSVLAAMLPEDTEVPYLVCGLDYDCDNVRSWADFLDVLEVLGTPDEAIVDSLYTARA